MSFAAAGFGVAAAGLGTSIYGMMSGKKNAKRQEAAVKAALAERERKINSIYDRMGMSGKAAIDRSTQDATGAATQSAVNRGLGNTSVLDTMQGEARSAGLQSQLQLQDQIARGRAGALSDLPIAVPDKPATADSGALLGQSLSQLGGLLSKIPGANPNTVQNTVQGLGAGGAPANQLPPRMNPYAVAPVQAAPPPTPTMLAGSTDQAAPGPWAQALKRRGIAGYAGTTMPYAGRAGF